ncbi:MAG: carbamoyltransferase [Myxococcota bacterium]|nr:carbamoyltransferase [Myxococcota bacterium]
MRVLGISCWYHDSAACLLEDGRIVAAAQEERFTRIKHDEAFPANAIRYCLEEAGSRDVDVVAFYDKPILKLHRILETSLATAPRGLGPFLRAVPVWLRDKLWIEPRIMDGLRALGVKGEPRMCFPEHHRSHAASAFYPSPFREAAVLTLDGVGEWATATLAVGEGARLEMVEALEFPHSLGLLYSAFTYFTGFKVNSGEYKLMGLAPYGEGRYTKTILEKLVDLKDDGSFRLDLDYFGYLDDVVMTNARFADLFGGPARSPEARIGRREMDLAKSIQEVTEEIVLRIARHAREVTGKKHLCMAGGVALNCVANGRLLRAGIFDDLWIQPGAGDAGGAIGAAYSAWHGLLEQPREADGVHDRMQGAYLGPEFSPAQIQELLDARGYPYERIDDDEAWAARVAGDLADQKVVGLFQGRMEFGPRSLGNRSIVGDARSPAMQSRMNIAIKQRESFRPFAPSVLEERAADFFELDRPSPYMLLVADVRAERRTPGGGEEARSDDLIDWVNRARSDVPAITHVDHSARVQTVSRDTNARYHALLRAFESRTGYGLLINTSFNVRGEPIVCTPEDAYRCFMGTAMDVLSLGPFVLRAEEQPGFADRAQFAREFAPD